MGVGMRVIRGPDWKLQNQDGGEGHVGTIVEILRNVNYNKPEKTVVVQWDSGSRTRCRVGFQNEYELLVWDSAPTGRKHPRVSCDSCEQNGIFGTRWQCTQCHNYDLCHSCYMNSKHDLSHPFYRYDSTERAARVRVSERSNAIRLEVKGIFPGAIVMRGPDWNSSNEDGGPGNHGKVLKIQDFDNKSGRSIAVVQWDSGSTHDYRLGHRGKVDLMYVSAASGGFYIWEHLLPLKSDHLREETTLHDLPLEVLDIILEKSYLHWSLNSSTEQRNEEVIRSLILVDVCFYRRITRERFKRKIVRHLKDFYGKTKRRHAIIRNNRDYFLINIQPSEELIASMFSQNCITEEQIHFIKRQRSNRNKNANLLNVLRSFDEKKNSKFLKILRQTNQKTVAGILEDGGVVIKVEVQALSKTSMETLQTQGGKCTTSIETQLLHQKIQDLQNRAIVRSHETEKMIRRLNDDGIEILNSQLLRQHAVVWLWCHSQAALEHIQKLYESSQFASVFLENIQPSISKMVNIDWNQFKKTVVVCPISINFTQMLDVSETVDGVTTLNDKIYILVRQPVNRFSSFQNEIRVYEDQTPFRPRKEIKIAEVFSPVDIGSSEKENCLYICDFQVKRVWKIKKEAEDQHKLMNWLTTDFNPRSLSVSKDGQLLTINQSSSTLTESETPKQMYTLMIYGSDAKLIRSMTLPTDFEEVTHAAKTSIESFIIIHQLIKEEKKTENRKMSRTPPSTRVISELIGDGQMVIRRFILSNKTQMKNPSYLSLDSDDRVFVADYGNNRAILLDSDLKWNRIISEEEEDTDKMSLRCPTRLCYSEEKQQLIVGGYGLHIYRLCRK